MKNRLVRFMQKHEVVKNAGYIFGASLLGSVALLASNLVLARLFEPALFGEYKTIVSFFAVVVMATEFGVNQTLAKYVAEYSDGRVRCLVEWLLGLKLAVYLAAFGSILLFRDLIAHYLLEATADAGLVVAGLAFSLFYFEAFKYVAVGLKEFKLYAASLFLTPFSAGILTVIFGHVFGVQGAICAYALGYLLGNLPVALIVAKRLRNETDHAHHPAPQKIFASYSIPIYLISIPAAVNMAAIPAMSALFSPSAVGHYSLAWTFYSGINLIPSAISWAIFPAVSKMSGNNQLPQARATRNKALLYYLPLALAGVAGAVLFSPAILAAVGPKYLAGAGIFRALVSLGFVSGLLVIYKMYFAATAQLKKATIVTLVNTVLLYAVSLAAMNGTI